MMDPTQMKNQSLRIHVFGAVYGDPATPSYITTEGTPVWMWRKGQRVRFLAADGTQIGPEHSNIAPAMCSAAAAGWIDPDRPWLSMMTTIEVRATSKPYAA